MTKVAVFATVGRAFSDSILLVRAMPILAFAYAALHTAFPLIREHYKISDFALTPEAMLLSTVTSAAFMVLTAPVDIAFYRFLLGGEVTSGYKLDIRDERFRRYNFWQFAILLLLLNAITWTILFFAGENDVLRWSGELLAFFAWFACSAGSVLLFPAVAADAREVTLRNALANVRGAFWRTIAILILIWLPFAVFSILLWAGNNAAQIVPDSVLNGVASLTDTVLSVAAIAAGARLFSLLWRPLGGHPPD